MATFSRQMLSRHKTTATYEGREEGRESMLKVRQIFMMERAPGYAIDTSRVRAGLPAAPKQDVGDVPHHRV